MHASMRSRLSRSQNTIFLISATGQRCERGGNPCPTFKLKMAGGREGGGGRGYPSCNREKQKIAGRGRGGSDVQVVSVLGE